MAAAPPGGAREVGVELAAEALAQLKPRVQGAYLMPPFGRVESAIGVLERVGVLGQSTIGSEPDRATTSGTV
jgi:hypothetical protein